ncbi:MAG: SLC13 family permease [Saprospiraceae bacterium]
MVNLFKSFAEKFSYWRIILFIAGPIFALYFIISFHNYEDQRVFYTLGIAIWMALWWISEVAPLAITSLLPVVLFPAFGIIDGKDVSASYFNHVIFLFIGGFLMALAIQKWNLHKRIALKILLAIGLSPAKILFGFMFATAILSMWISNTATALMMVPVLMSILIKLEDINGSEYSSKFGIGLLLSIAYSASIGGIVTLVGTPPNLSFVRIFDIYFPNAPEIGFGSWMVFALPIGIILFLITYIYLYFIYVKPNDKWEKIDKKSLIEELQQLGKVSYEEKIILALFIILAKSVDIQSRYKNIGITIPGWCNLFIYHAYQ